MNAAQFQAAAADIFQNYWRIKAANALYRSSEIAAAARLDYTGVPTVGLARMTTATESVADAISAMNDFIANRLRRDLFFGLIAEFETRLAARLVTLGATGGGTLGQLQVEIERRVPVPPPMTQDVVEVRERRNAMIHHGDLAHARYVMAAAAVQARSGRYVAAAALGDNVTPSATYLAYATDVLVCYSNAIG